MPRIHEDRLTSALKETHALIKDRSPKGRKAFTDSLKKLTQIVERDYNARYLAYLEGLERFLNSGRKRLPANSDWIRFAFDFEEFVGIPVSKIGKLHIIELNKLANKDPRAWAKLLMRLSEHFGAESSQVQRFFVIFQS